ncbi:DUF1648 domain-containing protein [Solibacillus sp. FSL H8-0538]|uniref:DUF1648 domain-containing protein n=1 Tax=Solibacillus sp. FSL H8-0538 TaxID=2921400 RepID=UPI0030F80F1E
MLIYFRPKLILPKTTAEKIADIIGIGALLIAILYLIMSWSSLPLEVPAHYGIGGEVDRWGSKYELLLLPVIGCFLHLILNFAEKRPHTHNYPDRLNESNVEAFYTHSRKMLNYTKNICNILFAYITWRTVLIGLGQVEGLGMIPFTSILIALFVVIGWGIFKSVKIK